MNSGVTSVSSNVSSVASTFIPPKQPEVKAKRVVEVKALKLAALKKKRDEQRLLEQKLERSKKLELAQGRKQKLATASAASSISSSSKSTASTASVAESRPKMLDPKNKKLGKKTVGERLKDAQQRRLDADKRKVANREKKLKQRELLMERRRNEEEARTNEAKEWSNIRSTTSVLAPKVVQKLAAVASSSSSKPNPKLETPPRIQRQEQASSSQHTAIAKPGFAVPTPPAQRQQAKRIPLPSPDVDIRIPEQPPSYAPIVSRQ